MYANIIFIFRMKKILSIATLCLLTTLGVRAQLSSNPYKFLVNITTRGNVEAGG